jgi:hypothetical protein
MAFLAGRMIWEFGYRRSKMEKIYRRIRTVYTTANTVHAWTHDPFHEVRQLVDYIIHPFHSKRSWSGWSGFEAQAHKRSRIALATDQSMHILETHASLSAAGSSLYLSFFLAFSLGFTVVAQQYWQ